MDSPPVPPVNRPSFTCFVIMPFSNTAHEVAGVKKTTSAAEWTNIYQDWIKKAVESYPDANISCERSATAAGNFVKGIVGSLNDSNFVIADLTGNKPNVYYELGIRHALRTGTIIITQHRSALPSDLQTYYCLEYTYSGAHHEYSLQYSTFETQIHGLLTAIIAQKFASDSPVSDFLEGISYTYLKNWMVEKNDAVSLMRSFCAVLDEYVGQLGRYISSECYVGRSDTFELDLCISQFFTSRWKMLDGTIVSSITRFTLDFRTWIRELYSLCHGRNTDAGDRSRLITKYENNQRAYRAESRRLHEQLKALSPPKISTHS